MQMPRCQMAPGHKLRPPYLVGYMMTSSNETFSALLAFCAGNSPGIQKPVTRSFGVFFDLCLNKRVSKQSWDWWSETPSSWSWRQCNESTDSSLLTLKRKCLHFDEIFITKFSSFEVVKMTTSSAASDENPVKMTFSLRWITCSHIHTNTLYSQSIIPSSIYQ